jgi:hypothetical protein
MFLQNWGATPDEVSEPAVGDEIAYVSGCARGEKSPTANENHEILQVAMTA